MNIIAAVNRDWGIGYNGTQSIVIPGDRRRFKELTSGGTVISGRKTFEDFGTPLPDRKNIILTQNREYSVDRAVIAHSIGDVFEEIACEPPDKVFVIGGESVYRLFLPMSSFAYVTKIDAAPPSDTFFPNLDELPEWEIIEQKKPCEYAVSTNVHHDTVRYSFVLYRNNSVYLP